MKTVLAGVVAASAIATVSALTPDEMDAARAEYCTTVPQATVCPTLFADVGSVSASTVCGGFASMYPVKDLMNVTGTVDDLDMADPEDFFNIDCRFGAIKQQQRMREFVFNAQMALTGGGVPANGNVTVATAARNAIQAAYCVPISHLGWDPLVYSQVNATVYQLSPNFALFGYNSQAEFLADNQFPMCGLRANAACHMVHASAVVPCKGAAVRSPFMYESLNQCLWDMYTVMDDPMGFMASPAAPILSGATTDCRIFYGLIAAKANLEDSTNTTYIKNMCGQTTWTGGAFCTSAAKAAAPMPKTDPCEQFCNSFEAYCPYSAADFTDVASCNAYCMTWIPDLYFNATTSAGVPTATRSNLNSIGCRKYHLLAAQASEAAATTHCPHAGKNTSAVCNQELSSSASAVFPSLAVLFALCATTLRLY